MYRPLQLLRVLLLVLLVLLTVQIVFAQPGVNSLNARFPRFQEADNIIHIFVFDDNGRPGQPPAIVEAGEMVIMGFEWEEPTIADILTNVINNPNHDITVSVDGGAAFSLKSLYQDPFMAATLSGPRWKWDHDGDGPGDGDGDSIGDWDNAVSFFRYAVSDLSVGTHTFLFTVTDIGGVVDDDLITVEVVAP